ncbi:MAG: hypothetical protein M0P01_12185 [Treponema sp.]|nr:hypothetical protein [Treponema sp.]
MKKLFISSLLALFICLSVFAADGVMSGEKNIKVVQTEWFDIIYPVDSERSAALLAEKADGVYKDICSALGVEQWARFPVVLTPAQDEFNAYFTSTFYNHIVLYDTSETEDMAVFSDTLLSTFRHELTHAVTYNMKNKFWRTIGSVFGDTINPGWLIMTSSHAEGAAVTSESMSGEGRLNDSYSAQMVRQAKIEGTFPGYADIYGAHDKYPGNQNYYFGSAFDLWLQKTYGMEKYAQFWYKCVNFQTIHQSLAFKSVYGLPVKDAWKQFEDSVVVPDIPPDPLENDGYADFFSATAVRSRENSRGSLYTSLSECNGGAAYCDDYSSSCFFSKWDEKKKQYAKGRKLFTVLNMNRAVLSTEGKYAAVSLTSENHAVPKNEVRIYSLHSHSWYLLNETGFRDAAIITNRGRVYLAAVKTKSQNTSLCIYALTENAAGTRIRGAELFAEIPFPSGDVPFSLADGGNGSVVYIYKSGMNWSICFYSITDGTTVEYKAPVDHMVIRNISSADTNDGTNVYTFSWSKPGSMPRFGELCIVSGRDASMRLQSDDISGGVYCPVTLRTGRILYSGKFFRDWRLLTVNQQKIRFDSFVVHNDANRAVSAGDIVAANADGGSATGNIPIEYPQLKGAEEYKPFDYYRRGIFLPFSDNETYTYEDGEFKTIPLLCGITYASSNPWTSGIVEISTGYNPLTNSGAVKTYFKSGTATSLFNYALYNQVEFDRSGYKQTMNILQLSSEIPVGCISYITFGNTTEIFEGKQSLAEISRDTFDSKSIFGCLEGDDITARFIGLNEFSAGYTNIHKTGPGTYEQGGFSVTASYHTSYTAVAGNVPSWNNLYQNISPDLVVKLPFLLPYVCLCGYTYNFPFKIESSLFPVESVFLNNTGTIILFAGEVQKAVPFCTLLYISRYRFSAEYTGAFKYNDGSSWDFFNTPGLTEQMFSGNMNYYDSFGLQAVLTMIPNIGYLASANTSFNLSAELKYRIRRTVSQNPFIFTIKFNVLY